MSKLQAEKSKCQPEININTTPYSKEVVPLFIDKQNLIIEFINSQMLLTLNLNESNNIELIRSILSAVLIYVNVCLF